MIREIKTTKTGMITTKIETGLTIEEDQTNTNTTETILILSRDKTMHGIGLICESLF